MYDTIEVVTPAAVEPVTAADLRGSDAVAGHSPTNNGTVEDTEITRFLVAARETFEEETDGRIVISTVFRQYLTGWCDVVRLLRCKATAVASVSYYDTDDELQTLTGYSTDLTGTIGLVYMPTGSWPSLSTRRVRPAYVQYTAGWANAAAVPSRVKLAILQLGAHWYANRSSHGETEQKEIPFGFQRFCNHYKTGLGRA